MNTLISYIFLPLTTVLVILSLCSCGASYNNRYFPVKSLAKRESSLGFSITPPTGERWYEKLNHDSLYYLKKTDRKDYAIYTKATEVYLNLKDLDEDKFLKFVMQSKKIDTDSGEFRNVSFQVIQYNELSPYCVRYNQIYEDHGANNLNNNEYLNVKSNGLFCMHPDRPLSGVDMYYVETMLHSTQTTFTSFKNEAEFFLSSLAFH